MESSSDSTRSRSLLALAPSWRLTAATAAMLLCLLGTSMAQDQATMNGTVTDRTGAVVPNVKITVSDAEKGVTRDTVSNSAGDYTVAKIPLGTYTVTAEATGFQKLLRTAIQLTAGQTLRVDLQLQVGQVTQEVTVAGNAPKVVTENGAVSDVVSNQQVTQLNLNGRVWMSLVTLLPGVSPLNDKNFNPLHLGFGSTQMIVSFNGSRANDANVEIDGGNVQNEPRGGRNIVVFPNIDSIAEFRVTTSDYGADIGKRPGAVIEVVTKSGTRDFHGTAYEFLRNDDLDANPFFINRTIHPSGSAFNPNYNAPKQPLKWNIFGFNFGGPV
jgi:Carboxypeptidase regulatory-like domain